MGLRTFAVAVVLAGALAVADAGGPRSVIAHEEGVQQLARVTVDALPAAPAAVELARFTLEPGAGRDLLVPGPAVYVVEAGTPGLRVEGPALVTRAPVNGVVPPPETLTAGIDHTLTFGDQVVVLARGRHAFVNDGLERAALLSAMVFPATALVPSWLPDETLPLGVGVVPLAIDVVDAADDLPTGPTEVALMRVAVAQDGVVADSVGETDANSVFDPLWQGDATGFERGEAALSGGLAGRFSIVLVEDGLLTVARGDGAETTHRAGEVIHLGADEEATLRNGGEGVLVVLALTIAPLADSASSPTSRSSAG